jgi:opacity protein-like surface antigen
MQILRHKLLVLAALALTGTAFANGDGYGAGTFNSAPTSNAWWHNIYLGIEGGVSWQRGLDILPDYTYTGSSVITPLSDSTRVFDHINASAPVYGLKLGYFITQQFAMDLAYNHRGKFEHENAIDLTSIGLPYVANDFKITGLHSDTVMLNFSAFPKVDLGGFNPFIAAGVGLAFNELGDYRDKGLIFAPSHEAPWDFTIASNKTTSFAWQVGAGANYVFNQHFFATAGYRFVDLGKFESKDSGWNNLTNAPLDGGIYITPWKTSNVFTHEFYAALNYRF